ncbi:MAG: hypothetical protein ABIJ26_08650, partial [Candidatus Margulisiibacteriota bacterium]
MKQFNVITTALLDTPAVFTVNDIQAVIVEGEGSEEAESEGTLLSFSAQAPPPEGHESIKIKSIVENRAAVGGVNMPVPMTLNGDRKYVNEMTVTKPPKRIEGKLNYLVPNMMKQFEYSFNFAAWKPIESVNPETGEFVLEDMPFAEGQNVIAVCSTNAADVKNHQHMKIILNTIPMHGSQFLPLPNSFLKDMRPIFVVVFSKAAYSTSPLEEISLQKVERINELTGERVDVTDQVTLENYGEAYDKHLKVSYQPSENLPDGKYTLLVVVNSNVGTAQAMWSVTIDTKSPAITIAELQPYAPRGPDAEDKSLTIRYTASDEAASALNEVHCNLYDKDGNFLFEIDSSDSVACGEHFFNWSGLDVADGDYQIGIKAFDFAGNETVAKVSVKIDSTPPAILGAELSPNPLSSNTSEFGLTARTNEESTIFITFKNKKDDTTKSYLVEAMPESGDRTPVSFLANYLWKYDNTYTAGPGDGIYNVELTAQDKAGNMSAATVIENIRIDRTAPVVYGQTTLPYVLSNTGANPYQTTLTYKLSESDDAEANRSSQEGGKSPALSEAEGVFRLLGVRVKIYNENTGDLVKTIDPAPSAIGTENAVSVNL